MNSEEMEYDTPSSSTEKVSLDEKGNIIIEVNDLDFLDDEPTFIKTNRRIVRLKPKSSCSPKTTSATSAAATTGQDNNNNNNNNNNNTNDEFEYEEHEEEEVDENEFDELLLPLDDEDEAAKDNFNLEDDPEDGLELGDAIGDSSKTHGSESLVQSQLVALNSEFNYVFGPNGSFAEFYQETDPLATVDLGDIVAPFQPYARLDTYREGFPDFNRSLDSEDDSDGSTSCANAEAETEEEEKNLDSVAIDPLEKDEQPQTRAAVKSQVDEDPIKAKMVAAKASSVVIYSSSPSTTAPSSAATAAASFVEGEEVSPTSSSSSSSEKKSESKTRNPFLPPEESSDAQDLYALRQSQMNRQFSGPAPGSHDLCPPERVEDPAEWPRTFTSEEDHEIFLYRHGPASRYMMTRVGVLLPILPTLKRSELLKQYEEHPVIGKFLSSENPPWFYCGYELKVPVGVAAVLPHDDEQRVALLKHIPDSRKSRLCFEDLRPFMKLKRKGGKKGGGNSSGGPLWSFEQFEKWRERRGPDAPLPRHQRVHLWNDANLLAQYIDQCGGPFKAKFVCLDMEAACVRGNLAPQPLELALFCGGDFESFTPFCPYSSSSSSSATSSSSSSATSAASSSSSSSSSAVVEYQTFIHCGLPHYQTAALMLSLGQMSGAHGIPFRNCKLLRTDYKNIAKELSRYFIDQAEELIFIFKGNSNADVDAFRWAFAAANDEKDEDQSIPMIHGFSLTTLARVLELDPEWCRPSLRSWSSLDVAYNTLRKEVHQKRKFNSDNNNINNKEKERKEEGEEEEEDELQSPTIVPGRRCPPLPQQLYPKYCESCSFHQLEQTKERNPEMHCALLDSQLLFHRVQQMLTVYKSNQEKKEAKQEVTNAFLQDALAGATSTSAATSTAATPSAPSAT